MESLDNTLAAIFEKIAGAFDHKQTELELQKVLQAKRLKCNSHEEYIDKLLADVAFHVEYCKALRELHVDIIKGGDFPDLDASSKVLQAKQEEIKQEMHRLVSIYQKAVENEHTPAEKIAKLEILYRNSKLSSDLLAGFLETFGNEENEQYFRPLFGYNPEQTVQVMQRYADYHAASMVSGMSLR